MPNFQPPNPRFLRFLRRCSGFPGLSAILPTFAVKGFLANTQGSTPNFRISCTNALFLRFFLTLLFTLFSCHFRHFKFRTTFSSFSKFRVSLWACLVAFFAVVSGGKSGVKRAEISAQLVFSNSLFFVDLHSCFIAVCCRYFHHFSFEHFFSYLISSFFFFSVVTSHFFIIFFPLYFLFSF